MLLAFRFIRLSPKCSDILKTPTNISFSASLQGTGGNPSPTYTPVSSNSCEVAKGRIFVRPGMAAVVTVVVVTGPDAIDWRERWLPLLQTGTAVEAVDTVGRPDSETDAGIAPIVRPGITNDG